MKISQRRLCLIRHNNKISQKSWQNENRYKEPAVELFFKAVKIMKVGWDKELRRNHFLSRILYSTNMPFSTKPKGRFLKPRKENLFSAG